MATATMKTMVTRPSTDDDEVAIDATQLLVGATAEDYDPQMVACFDRAKVLMQSLANNDNDDGDEHGKQLCLSVIDRARLYDLRMRKAEDYAADAEDYNSSATARTAVGLVEEAEEAAEEAKRLLEELERWVGGMPKLRLFRSFEEGLGKEWRCTVCLDDDEGEDTLKARMPCNHVFHKKCLNKWLATSFTCPLCRYDL